MQQLLNDIQIVQVPKYLAIKNGRLAFLLRLLQAIAIAWVIYTASTTDPKPWERTSVPIGYGVAAWCDPTDTAASETIAIKHCDDTSSYRYSWSDSWTYDPQFCKELPHREKFSRTPDSLFIPTFVQDSYSWEGQRQNCGNGTREACERTLGSQYAPIGKSCACTRSESYFMKNPEELIVSLLHGYEVQRSNLFDSPTKIERGQINIPSNNVITIVKGRDGQECSIDGLHVWSVQDSTLGISGKLGDWLACGGVHLDMAYDETRSHRTGETKAPHARITGVKLVIELFYTNPHRGKINHHGPGADARVIALPQWNAWNNVIHTQQPGLENKGSARLATYAYGVSVQLTARGQVGDISMYKIIDMVVSAIVVVGLPASVIYWVAIFGAGKLSSIYSRAAREDLDICRDFASGICKTVSAASAFRVLSGQADVESGNILPATELQIAARIRECFGSYLDDDQLEMITRRTARVLRHEDTEEISLERFVNECYRKDCMPLRELVDLVDPQNKRGLLDYIFDNTYKFKRSSRCIASEPKAYHDAECPVGRVPDEKRFGPIPSLLTFRGEVAKFGAASDDARPSSKCI